MMSSVLVLRQELTGIRDLTRWYGRTREGRFHPRIDSTNWGSRPRTMVKIVLEWKQQDNATLISFSIPTLNGMKFTHAILSTPRRFLILFACPFVLILEIIPCRELSRGSNDVQFSHQFNSVLAGTIFSVLDFQLYPPRIRTRIF